MKFSVIKKNVLLLLVELFFIAPSFAAAPLQIATTEDTAIIALEKDQCVLCLDSMEVAIFRHIIRDGQAVVDELSQTEEGRAQLESARSLVKVCSRGHSLHIPCFINYIEHNQQYSRQRDENGNPIIHCPHAGCYALSEAMFHDLGSLRSGILSPFDKYRLNTCLPNNNLFQSFDDIDKVASIGAVSIEVEEFLARKGIVHFMINDFKMCESAVRLAIKLEEIVEFGEIFTAALDERRAIQEREHRREMRNIETRSRFQMILFTVCVICAALFIPSTR